MQILVGLAFFKLVIISYDPIPEGIGTEGNDVMARQSQASQAGAGGSRSERSNQTVQKKHETNVLGFSLELGFFAGFIWGAIHGFFLFYAFYGGYTGLFGGAVL
ncbi:hypothetical protein [Paenibacillus yonginensis]|uniref:hypothetical protein n=1 Tax=Paenibacillus yonginensis TaxID=1462996 RepID=UPI0030019BC6